MERIDRLTEDQDPRVDPCDECDTGEYVFRYMEHDTGHNVYVCDACGAQP